MALFPLRNPITEATGCLGGIAMHCVHGLASEVLRESGIPSAALTSGRSSPIADGSGRRGSSAGVWAPTPRDTCSPIWNGIASGKALTLNPPHYGHQDTRGAFYSWNGQTF